MRNGNMARRNQANGVNRHGGWLAAYRIVCWRAVETAIGSGVAHGESKYYRAAKRNDKHYIIGMAMAAGAWALARKW